MKKIIIYFWLIISYSILAQDIFISTKYTTSLFNKEVNEAFIVEGGYEFSKDTFGIGLLVGWSNIIFNEFRESHYKEPYALIGFVGYYYPFRFSSNADSSLYLSFQTTKILGSLESQGGGHIFEPGLFYYRTKNSYVFTVSGGYKKEFDFLNFLIEFGAQYRIYDREVDRYIEKNSFPIFYKTLKISANKFSFIAQFGFQFVF